MPTTLSRLEHAVRRAHAAYDKAGTAAREQQRADRPAAEADPNGIGDELGEDLEDAA